MDQPQTPQDGPQTPVQGAPQTPASPAPQQPAPEQHPIKQWFDALIHGTDQTKGNRIAEVARSVGRGVSSAVQEGVNTVAEGAAAFDRKTGLGEAIQPGYNAAYDDAGAANLAKPFTADLEAGKTALFGKKTDDPLANFAESAAQFTAGFEFFGELKGVNALGKAGSFIARAGLTDATMMNPYEAGLAELAARAPNAIVKQVGDLLSVKGDDGPVVARLKRAGASVISSAALESVVAAARAVRSMKLLSSPAATAAEKETAQATLDESTKTLQSIGDGTHVSEDDHVVVMANRDGTFSLVPKKPNNKIDLSLPLTDEGDAEFRKQVDSKTPIFADRAEAETQAASINGALDEHINAGKPLPQETVDNVGEAVADPEKMAQIQETPDLGTSIHDTPDETIALVKQLAQKMQNVVDNTVATKGELPVPDALKAASDLVRQIPEDVSHPVLKGLLKETNGQEITSVAADIVLRDKGQKIAKLLDGVEARPQDPILKDQLRTAVEQHADLGDAMYSTKAGQARVLRFTQERPAIGEIPAEYAKSIEEAGGEAVNAAPAQSAPPPLSDEEVQNYARLVRLAGPDGPRNVEAIAQAVQIQRATGVAAKGIEYFVNNLLSGPLTWAKVATTTATMSAFEPAMRVAAGLAFNNSRLIQEGADILYGNFRYALENVSSAAKALREGRAITNPMPTHVAIGGPAGDVIRTPGRILTALHEMATVTNYRSYVRAMSLSNGRAAGLTGDALAQYVEKDLGVAFDPKTGIATIPEALEYAKHSTFTDNLGSETVGGAFQDFTNSAWQAKFIAPFVKIGTNIFRYGKSLSPWDLAKGLSGDLTNEDTQVNVARAAIGSSIYAGAMYGAYGDMLTGSGPSGDSKDGSALRKEWLQDHQPYSIKIGNQWVSYQRIEPFSTVLGIASDLQACIHEMGDRTNDAEKIAYSTLSGITHNLASKSYFEGITNFFDAWASGDVKKLQYWIEGLDRGIVPFGPALKQMNPDDTFRNVRTSLDALMNNIPGLSKTLDPSFNMFGEPNMKAPWYANRSLNIATVKPFNPNSEENTLLQLDQGLAPYPQQIKGTQIDLSDRNAYDNGSGVSPYVQLMQYLRTPEDGSPSLRDAMKELIKSPEWEDASGTVRADDFINVGGKKFELASALKTKYEGKALMSVLNEYPKLKDAWISYEKLKAKASTGGPDAQAQVMDALKQMK